MVEKIREIVEYRVTKDHLFTLGKLIKDMLKNGWSMIYCTGKEDGEYVAFERMGM